MATFYRWSLWQLGHWHKSKVNEASRDGSRLASLGY